MDDAHTAAHLAAALAHITRRPVAVGSLAGIADPALALALLTATEDGAVPDEAWCAPLHEVWDAAWHIAAHLDLPRQAALRALLAEIALEHDDADPSDVVAS